MFKKEMWVLEMGVHPKWPRAGLNLEEYLQDPEEYVPVPEYEEYIDSSSIDTVCKLAFNI
jgi:hypothetical protein